MKRLIYIFSAVLTAVFLLGACNKYDDSALKESIEGLNGRLDSLEAYQNDVQTDLTALYNLLTKLDEALTVDNVTDGNGGYTITFSDGTSVFISDGADGAGAADGADGIPAPVITVIEYNGTTYWGYIDEEGDPQFFLVDGKRVPTSAVIPQVRINSEGYWEVSVDGGEEWTAWTVNAMGEDAVFTNISEDEDYVYITLPGGNEIVLPKTPELSFTFLLDGEPVDIAYFEYGEAKTFEYTMSDSAGITVTKPYGWKVDIYSSTVTVTAPVEENVSAETSGTVSVILSVNGVAHTSELDVVIGTVPPVTSEAPEVGDYYYADGTWSTDLDASKSPIGVVYWIGDPTADDPELLADHPGCTHGLVVASNYTGEAVSWGPLENISSWIESNITYENTAADYSDGLVFAYGYTNTKAIEAYNAANPDNAVTVIQEVIKYREAVPAPENSSDWYMMHGQEAARLYIGQDVGSPYDDLFGEEPEYLDVINPSLTAIPGADLLNIGDIVWLAGQSTNALEAYMVGFDSGNGVYYQYKYDLAYVRCILAF